MRSNSTGTAGFSHLLTLPGSECNQSPWRRLMRGRFRSCPSSALRAMMLYSAAAADRASSQLFGGFDRQLGQRRDTHVDLNGVETRTSSAIRQAETVAFLNPAGIRPRWPRPLIWTSVPSLPDLGRYDWGRDPIRSCSHTSKPLPCLRSLWRSWSTAGARPQLPNSLHINCCCPPKRRICSVLHACCTTAVPACSHRKACNRSWQISSGKTQPHSSWMTLSPSESAGF